MSTGDRLSSVANVTFIIAAVVLAGLAVRQQFSSSGALENPTGQVRHVADWRAYAQAGHRMGAATAPVTILEFADFECPVCRAFTNGALRAVRAQYGGRVAVVFRHLPLTYHHLAYPTARGSECASAQGRFEAFHDNVYAHQDSLGIESFVDFARAAGVPDLAAFERCNNSNGSVAAVDADLAAAKRLGTVGTPTVIINGTLLPGAPDSAQLDGYVRAALKAAGRPN